MQPRLRLRRLIVALGGGLVVAVTAFAVYDAWRLYRQLNEANERELSNLAKALADESARGFRSLDMLLRDTAAWYENAGSGLDAATIQAALAARVLGVSPAGVLTIVDAGGHQRYRSRVTGEPLSEVSDRLYFQIHRDGQFKGLYISAPLVTRSERQEAVVVSVRLSKADGSFDGVVTATVNLGTVRSMFSVIQLGPGSALLLALDEGILIARQPFIPGMEGATHVPEIVAYKGGAPVDHAVSPADGRAKLIAAVGVGDWPLTLAITRDEEVALLPWRESVWSAAVRTVLLALLVVVIVAWLLRQVHKAELRDQALRESEERYALAMEAANEGHLEWHVQRETVFRSKRWQVLHNLEGQPEVTPASTVFTQVALHPDDEQALKTALRQHLEGRSPFVEIDYRVRVGGGGGDGWRWIHARGRCVRDAAGAPLRFFLAGTDITQRKQAEADRLAFEARAQQARRLEALGTLAGGIAHDFNNILGAILGFGQMAQQQSEPGSAVRRHVDRVLQAGWRARLLVRRILDFSRSGLAERAPVNLQAVVEEVLALLRPTLPAGVALSAQLETMDAAVMGDATQLHQVVMNLCTNAAQAVGEHGSIEVNVRRVASSQREALMQGSLQPGAYLRVDVADTGAGIAPDVLERIFDPFFSTKKVGEGTGLGLSVVHGIVADMGGAVDISARRPQGTLASVWLPDPGLSAPAASSASADWPRGNGQVVMVVDDESALVELAEELLAELGYEPVGFTSSGQALAAFQDQPQRFDALLTDEAMPDLTGCELARAVRALRPALPVVLMTGNIDEGLEPRMRAAGVQALLHKPLALQDLAACLARTV